MRSALAWLLAAGCATAVPEDQPCVEASTAIGARTAACTGDQTLGTERIEAFDARYVCDPPTLSSPEQARDLYSCALSVRALACELVVDYGDDFDAWLDASPTCGLLFDPVAP